MTQKKFPLSLFFLVITLLLCGFPFYLVAQNSSPEFKVVSFYKGINDPAHVSFVKEANTWFSKMAIEKNFIYNSTNDWDNMNPEFLSGYDVVVFLDVRPDSANHRKAFEQYMENGGSWLGFHFCAFALTPSAYSQNWDWYHNKFLGSGEFKGNTWQPTSAVLRIENNKHVVTKNLPETFISAPNEWYSWENDLRKNQDIDILLSIDSSSFPLGTGPKLYEIWHEGYFPVVWTNKKYNMIYVNMGHNDIDYEHNTNLELSFTFTNEIQNNLILESLQYLGKKRKNNSKN